MYGQGDGFTERAMLVYDGLHYDALAVSGDTSTLPLCTHQGYLLCIVYVRVLPYSGLVCAALYYELETLNPKSKAVP